MVLRDLRVLRAEALAKPLRQDHFWLTISALRGPTLRRPGHAQPLGWNCLWMDRRYSRST
jgi:hypothetical protein